MMHSHVIVFFAQLSAIFSYCNHGAETPFKAGTFDSSEKNTELPGQSFAGLPHSAGFPCLFAICTARPGLIHRSPATASSTFRKTDGLKADAERFVFSGHGSTSSTMMHSHVIVFFAQLSAIFSYCNHGAETPFKAGTFDSSEKNTELPGQSFAGLPHSAGFPCLFAICTARPGLIHRSPATASSTFRKTDGLKADAERFVFSGHGSTSSTMMHSHVIVFFAQLSAIFSYCNHGAETPFKAGTFDSSEKNTELPGQSFAGLPHSAGFPCLFAICTARPGLIHRSPATASSTFRKTDGLKADAERFVFSGHGSTSSTMMHSHVIVFFAQLSAIFSYCNHGAETPFKAGTFDSSEKNTELPGQSFAGLPHSAGFPCLFAICTARPGLIHRSPATASSTFRKTDGLKADAERFVFSGHGSTSSTMMHSHVIVFFAQLSAIFSYCNHGAETPFKAGTFDSSEKNTELPGQSFAGLPHSAGFPCLFAICTARPGLIHRSPATASSTFRKTDGLKADAERFVFSGHGSTSSTMMHSHVIVFFAQLSAIFSYCNHGAETPFKAGTFDSSEKNTELPGQSFAGLPHSAGFPCLFAICTARPGLIHRSPATASSTFRKTDGLKADAERFVFSGHGSTSSTMMHSHVIVFFAQ
ncbi:hypothetical protein V5799_027173, partial [Amblyomma americanum]